MQQLPRPWMGVSPKNHKDNPFQLNTLKLEGQIQASSTSIKNGILTVDLTRQTPQIIKPKAVQISDWFLYVWQNVPHKISLVVPDN